MIILCVLVIVLSAILAGGYLSSQKIEFENFVFKADIQKNIRIVLVGDTHFPFCFAKGKDLLNTILSYHPNVIIFSGDIIDGDANEKDVENLQEFFLPLSKSCLCLLTIGNHEIGSPHLDLFAEIALSSGIILLQNEIVTKQVNGENIEFLGLSDGYPFEEKTFSQNKANESKLKILISHRPEKFPEYTTAPKNIRPDFVFAGHAHGGLMRIGKQGLYAPNQGLFPKYTSGLYENNGVKMIVTRGLGVSGVDLRFFNPYHLPIIDIVPKK